MPESGVQQPGRGSSMGLAVLLCACCPRTLNPSNPHTHTNQVTGIASTPDYIEYLASGKEYRRFSPGWVGARVPVARDSRALLGLPSCPSLHFDPLTEGSIILEKCRGNDEPPKKEPFCWSRLGWETVCSPITRV